MSDLNCTCYRLRKAARRVTQIYDRHLAAQGLTANQFGILAELERGGPVSLGALAESLGADPSTLTRNVQPLRQMGAVEIASAADLAEEGDRRRKVVRLTDGGRERLTAALGPWRAAEQEVARALGQRDVAQLRDLLAELGAALGPTRVAETA